MKKLMVFFFSLCIISANAQNRADRWPVTAGVVGGFNFSKFIVSGTNSAGIGFSTQTGGAGGIWVNIPFGRVVSMEPQFLYSAYLYKPTNSTGYEGSIHYGSLPLLFKFQLAGWFAITAGPQFDYVGSATDKRGNDVKSDFTSFSTSYSLGIELFTHEWISVYGRYIGGLTDMNNVNTSANPEKLNNQDIQVGLKLRVFGHKHIPQAPVAVVATPTDTDGDGIPDNIDKCPTVPGVAKYNGCPIPDTDGDGINDELDKCPTVPGVAKYNGCPIPDSDGDGINDELDKCPTVPGVAKYNGCPIPDSDGDGVNDEEDRCPHTPGIASNLGCPEMTFYYKRDVAVLSADDKAQLDRVVKFMKNNPDIHIIIQGYTSTLGPAAYNMTLSQKRAGNTLKYLVSQGVDASRMKSVGFGEQFPIGDNSTPAGRAASRRTVIQIDK